MITRTFGFGWREARNLSVEVLEILGVAAVAGRRPSGGRVLLGAAVASQRRVLAGLSALRIPARFLRQLHLGAFTAARLVPTLTAVLATVVVALGFQLLHLGDPSPAYLPWPTLLGFAGATVVAAAVGSVVAALRIRPTERLVDEV